MVDEEKVRQDVKNVMSKATKEQINAFNKKFEEGVYKQFYKDGLLTDEQLRQLLALK